MYVCDLSKFLNIFLVFLVFLYALILQLVFSAPGSGCSKNAINLINFQQQQQVKMH